MNVLKMVLLVCVIAVAIYFCLAPIARLTSPGYSCCGHCGFPWTWVEGHATPYSKGGTNKIGDGIYVKVDRAMFPLCETCWSGLSVEERIPYYESLFESWNKEHLNGITIEDIRESVRREGE